jgi:hypothetical protein
MAHHGRAGRREFLKVLGAAGIAAVGGYAMWEFSPWVDRNGRAAALRDVAGLDFTGAARMESLIRCAVLAANAHNSQPWIFAARGDAIDILPDPSRALPVVDPRNRALWISLGCALENLRIAALATGWRTAIEYPEPQQRIRIRLERDKPHPSELFAAIPQRQNTRSEYDGSPADRKVLDQLAAVEPDPGVSVRWLTDRGGMDLVSEYLREGDRRQYANRAFREELIRWIRFSKKEALATGDGLYVGCTGNPDAPRWLGALFVNGTDPRRQAEADDRKLRSSAGAAVIASAVDEPGAWVRAGQTYERIALILTGLEMKCAFLNQPIEVSELRGQFQSALGSGGGLPQLLLRFGKAECMPFSLRRPLKDLRAGGG